MRTSGSKAHADLTDRAREAACSVVGVSDASVRLEWRAGSASDPVGPADDATPQLEIVDPTVIDDFEVVVSFSAEGEVTAAEVRAAVTTSLDQKATAVRVERIASAAPVPVANSTPNEANSTPNEAEQPLDEVEAAVAEVWQQVLRLKEVGRNADFFDLGGDSLTGIMVIGRLNASFGTELEVADLYDLPTLAEIAKALRSSD